MARAETPLDVLIVGAGITGIALGLALRQSGQRVRVLDHAPLPRFQPVPGFDQRIYAMSLASQSLLEAVGAWGRMDPERIQRIREMALWGDAQGQLQFAPAPGSGAPLGFIAESGAMLEGLLGAVRETGPDLIDAPVTLQDVTVLEDHVRVTLKQGRALRTRLLVAADGLHSPLRERMGIAAHFKSYDQKAVVANYATDRPHDGVARQWFLPGEVVALLPLPGNHVSLVWSAQTEHAEHLLTLSPPERTAALQAVVGYGVGHLEERSAPAGFDLRLMRVERLTAPRFVLVGDAAHGVHPMAGQGLNLGLQDAAQLAAILATRGHGPDCGDASVLRRYARARREPVLAMQGLTDGLFRLFGSDRWGLPGLRNWGMNIVNQQGWLKQRLMEHANK
ncbi:MAG: FAD-dependent monooxygenase [Betaproteobacteria bacterium]|nr:FAD-dependent monooxygenase [Betaproteobacteria bacterium]